jgi:hypothetical protein
MQDNTVAKLLSTRVQTPFSLNVMYGTVLRESLSDDSQNILCATLKRKGVVGNLCMYLFFLSYSLALILSQIPPRETNSAAFPTTYLPSGRWRPTQLLSNTAIELRIVVYSYLIEYL